MKCESSRDQLEPCTVRRHLERRHRFSEGLGPVIELAEAHLLKLFVLEIFLHDEDFRHTVGERGGGCAEEAAAVIEQVSDLDEHVPRPLRLVMRNSRHVAHLAGEEKIFFVLKFIHHQQVHAQLFPRDDLLRVLLHIAKGIQLCLEVLQRFLNDFSGFITGAFVFQLLEKNLQLGFLQLDESLLDLRPNRQGLEG